MIGNKPNVNLPLRFTLLRDHDQVAVADGCQFGDGSVVLRWRGEHPSTQTYADWGDVMRVHHVGEPESGDRWTTADWHDGVCFTCGTPGNWMCGGNGSQCCACSATWDGPPSRYKGEHAGVWRKIPPEVL